MEVDKIGIDIIVVQFERRNFFSATPWDGQCMQKL